MVRRLQSCEVFLAECFHTLTHSSTFLLVLILLVTPRVVLAQLYSGSLAGVVIDPSGAVIPGAEVTLTDTLKGFNYKTTTDPTGRFLLRPLPPTNYSLTVTVTGFKTFTQGGIVLAVNQSAELNVSLEVGSPTQTVSVTASAPLLQTQDATTGQEVSRNFIDHMPLVGRGVMDLTFLAPGVNPTPGGTYGSITGEWGSNNFTSNGGRNATAGVLVDGVTATGTEQNSGIQTVLYTPSVDDVQEFNVQQNSFSAQFGFSSNTVVNVVTRSGTNQFHGSAYEFFRNEALDANNWFSNAYGVNEAPLRYNDFGATAGGPIQKNKMFFFVDYEGYRVHTLSTFNAGVPSTAERQGDFGELCADAGGSFGSTGNCTNPNGQLWDPYSGVYDPNVGGAVRSGIIPYNNLATYTSPGNPNLVGTPFQLAADPGNLIDPAAQKMMAFFALPNVNVGTSAYNPYNNWAANGVNVYGHDQFDAKIDRHFGTRDTLSGRFTYGRFPNNGGARCFKGFMDPCSSGPGGFDNRAIALNNVFTLSPSTVMTASAGFTRELHQSLGLAASDYPNLNIPSALGLPSYMSASGVDTAPYISIGGAYYGYGLGQYPYTIYRYAQETWDLAVVLDQMRGRQEMKFGMNMLVHRINEGQPGVPGGEFVFNNFGTSQGPYYGGGDAMASFLVGTSVNGVGAYQIPAYIATINPEYSGFFQDNIRVNRKLTLNMGIRYEVTVPRTERHNRLDWFDPTAPSPLGNVPGLPPLTGLLVYASPGDRRGTNINWEGFAPRFGLAYRLSSKLVLRGGYGVYFSPSEWGVCGASGCASGFDGFTTTTYEQTTYNRDGATPWGRLSNPFPNGFIMPLSTPIPKGGDSLFNIGNGISPLLKNMNNLPYIQTWNAGFQYELPAHAVVTANYIGTKGTHLYFNGASVFDYLGSWVESASPSELASLSTYVNNPFYGIITDPNAPLSSPQVQAYQLLYQYPQYAGVWPGHPPEANSVYDAFQLQVNKRMSQGLEFLVNYTWSKCLDDASVGTYTTWLGGFGEEVDPNNLKLERSLSEYNIPQVLNVAYIFQLPFGRGRHWASHWDKWTEGFLGGWQTSGMWRFDNGQPLSVSTYGSIPLPGGYGQRADLIGQLHVNPRSKWFCSSPGCGYFSNQGPGQASTDVIVDPAPYTIGTAPRTLPNVRVPGTSTAALGLFKEIPVPIREGSHLEFRMEAFNALNHPQFCGPNTNIDSGGFGVITGQCNSPREVQFGLKYYW